MFFFLIVVELPGEGYKLNIDQILVAGKSTEPNASDSGFVGHMKNFFMEDHDFFQYLQDNSIPGGMTINNNGGHIGREFPLAVNLATFHAANNSFVTLQPLRIREGFEFEFMVKTRKRDGLLFYNGDAFSEDFFAVELIDGRIQFVVNDGSGPRLLRANSLQRLTDNQWHSVRIAALPGGSGFDISVDETNTQLVLPVAGRQFSLSQELYVGGVPKHMYDQLPDVLASKQSGSFQGCLASVRINKQLYHMTSDSLHDDHTVVNGCSGEKQIQ